MTDTTGISARHISVRFGALQALADVSFSAHRTRLLGVTGPSGAGKTTLMHVLAGVQPTDAGEVALDGVALAPADSRVALVPQTCGLSPWLTALESVALPLQTAGLARSEIEPRAREALASVGLSRFAGHLSTALSGGQQQRVAVARALARRADALLADEPTAELDAENRGLVMRLLREEADRGAVVVVASDDPLVSSACDGTLALSDGAIVSGIG